MEEEKDPNWVKEFFIIVLHINWMRIFCIIVLHVLGIVLTAYLFVGCSAESDDDLPEVRKVLLVYLGGDNNLSGESYAKLEAIRQGYKAGFGNRILIYQDARNVGSRMLEIGGQTIEEYNVENSADPIVLKRVINKAKSLYPQARFNLLVFSHASGWLPAGSYNNPGFRSIISDGQHEMDLNDFVNAIPDGMFDCIFFEACYMAGIETAYQLKDKAKYIAASSAEILSPGFTALYEKHVHSLLDDDPRVFMQAAFDYFSNQEGDLCSATFSITDTRKLDELAAYVQSDCDFAKEIPIDEIQHFDRYNSLLFCDFGDYYSRLLNTDEQRQKLQSLIDACIVWKAATPDFMLQYGGFGIDRHSGLTTYIRQERYPVLNASYTNLDWYKTIMN